MTQRNINEEAQCRRRKDAVRSAVTSATLLCLSAACLLILRWYFQLDGFWGAVVVIFSLLELGMTIPVWILLKTRLNEIEGGEEDAAAQY